MYEFKIKRITEEKYLLLNKKCEKCKNNKDYVKKI
jgi:hypothetical protein